MTRDPHWYKDAIIYQLHVKAFWDSNNDGIGDFAGLTQKLDYVQSLGATAIWLLPFYPSPLRDDGYDIADYRGVNSSYGDFEDFARFVQAAHERGLFVITELVINHTSDQHPWFQRARHAPKGSPEREFYVWADTDQGYQGTRIIFCDTETSNWSWDPVAKQYYWHRFYHHQPDLNWDNPKVFEEVTQVMRLWLDAGVDGMRLDAIPYLCEREGTNNENLDETHMVLKRLRSWLDEHYPGRMLLGEANQWPEDTRPYFGEGDECHMNFHFPLMPRLYMALAREDRHPIVDIMRQTPEIPEGCQWAIFLRNHDELTLEMVTDRERDYLWDFYAQDKRARINMGIRRRLAPLLENDRRKIELLNSLLMSMPGTPIVYYGDEIGMGDNIYLGDRDGVRTPMQWSPDRNGGFSRANPAQLYLPAIMDSVYGFAAVNVEAQAENPSSLLNWMKRLIAIRKANTVFGRGELRFLKPGNRKVLAYLREDDEGNTILCVANFSRVPQPVELDLREYDGMVPVELLGPSPFPPIGTLPYFITLPGYGFYWFRLDREADAPAWHAEHDPRVAELMTVVLPQGVASLEDTGPRRVLSEEILPGFLKTRRWFAGAAREPSIERLVRYGDTWALLLVQADGDTWYVPLGAAWETRTEDPMSTYGTDVVARIRRANRVGVLFDAGVDGEFARQVVTWMKEGKRIEAKGAELVARSADDLTVAEDAEVSWLGADQSNTSLRVGEKLLVKHYRRLDPGVHPEVEIGHFLTEVAGYDHTPPWRGSVELMTAEGPTALAIAHGFVPNEGDGWRFTLDYVQRFLDDLETGHPDHEHEFYTTMARTLGRRVAQLHRAFCAPGGGEAFDPEPITESDIALWREQVVDQAARARAALDAVEQKSPKTQRLLDQWDKVERSITSMIPKAVKAAKTRHHGDLHLGQVLVTHNDFVIIDFEGEPTRPLAERRRKHCPLRDVSGILRSFDYAAWSAVLTRREVRAMTLADIAPEVDEWRTLAENAFLEGYVAEVAGIASWPGDQAVARGLIDFFRLEKALYEVVYEAGHRPTWLRIPVQGVSRLVGVE